MGSKGAFVASSLSAPAPPFSVVDWFNYGTKGEFGAGELGLCNVHEHKSA